MITSGSRIFKSHSWFYLPLIYLLITALLGVLLRSLKLWDLGPNYVYILHTHSHIALLGWCHTSLFLFLVNAFIPSQDNQKRVYTYFFYAFQITVVGMLFFFPFQGYSPTTIAFSSLFLIVGYFFAFRFLKDTRIRKSISPPSLRFTRAAFIFFVISSIGPWALGPLNMNGLGGSDLYYNFIYFYLHFLYNGWFSFALLGLIFKYLEQKKIAYNITWAILAYRLLFASTLLGCSLSTLWSNPPMWVFIIGGISSIVQIIAVYYLFLIGRSTIKMVQLLKKDGIRFLFLASIALFTFKIVLQFLSAMPTIAELVAIIRDWVIAYLHLVLLGCFTPLFFLFYYRFLKGGIIRGKGIGGLVLFFGGFLMHELLLIYRGVASWQKLPFIDLRAILLISTSIILSGVMLLVFDLMRKQRI